MIDREELGRIVRNTWIKWCLETGHHAGNPHKIAPWEEMPESIREVDRRIGEDVARAAEGPLTEENRMLRVSVERLQERVRELREELAFDRGLGDDELARLKAEVAAVIERIPNSVRVCEGGGPENVAASLAVSVAKLISDHKRESARVRELEEAFRALGHSLRAQDREAALARKEGT